MGEFDAVSNNRPTLIKAPKPLSKNQYLIILITFCSSFFFLNQGNYSTSSSFLL
jgi:hypothetical protein